MNEIIEFKIKLINSINGILWSFITEENKQITYNLKPTITINYKNTDYFLPHIFILYEEILKDLKKIEKIKFQLRFSELISNIIKLQMLDLIK